MVFDLKHVVTVLRPMKMRFGGGTHEVERRAKPTCCSSWRAVCTNGQALQVGAYYIGVLNAAVISGFNSVYRLLSQRLTNWENHRTDR